MFKRAALAPRRQRREGQGGAGSAVRVEEADEVAEAAAVEVADDEGRERVEVERQDLSLIHISEPTRPY